MSADNYILYGSDISYYTGKTRSNLLHKGVPFVELTPNPWQYLVVFPRRVGAAVMPVVRTPDGEWWQDSSLIFDQLEQRFAEPAGLPATPVLRFAAYLFEFWADEFLLPMGWHTTWGRPERRPVFIEEVGQDMLPGWPRFLQQLAGKDMGTKMNAMSDMLGFTNDMADILNRLRTNHLDALDHHFATSPFLFGTRPCLGDFGLMGTIYSHMARPPAARRELVEPRPHLAAWLQRMNNPASSEGGEFREEDSVPDTLLPALRSIFDEMVPLIKACRDAVCAAPPGDSDRFLETISYPMAGGQHTRKASGYIVWMAQRLMAVYTSMSPGDQHSVHNWVGSMGGAALFELDLPPMRREGVKAVRTS